MRVREREREEFIERENLFILLYILLPVTIRSRSYIHNSSLSFGKFFSRFATKQKEHHGDDDREND